MKIEKGNWYLFNGHLATHKPLMLITKNNGSDVRFCGFNFLGEWVDKDSYTLEELKRYGHREATPQEVEESLIEEAKRKGVEYDSYIFDYRTNILWGNDNDDDGKEEKVLFKNGKWATIIEQDKFAELKEAHKNGSVIQANDGGDWYDTKYPNWKSKQYRIKPDVEQDPYNWVNNFLEVESEDEKHEERVIEQDNINPKHYTQYKIQPIDYIDANRFDFFEGNVIKYVSRYKEKNGLEDLKKAKVYLQRLIDRYETI